MVDRDRIHNALNQIKHPALPAELGDLEMIPKVEVSGSQVTVTVDLLTAASPRQEELLKLIRETAEAAGADAVTLETTVSQRSTQPSLGGALLGSVRNLVAVASGKGGVGKSTVASNLAAALAQEGARVGLLDADIYGPSIPALFGLEGSALEVRERRIYPAERFGLKIMSMGLLMKPGESVIWRGPMLHGIINQFCKDVEWGELDFLVIDLPPGTGDVSLSLSQLVPLGGAVVVSTPQEVALGVATKAVNMFRKLNVPLLGLVENMSHYACPHCQARDDLFGHGGVQRAAEELGLPFLGEIPLNSSIREAGDAGIPVVVHRPESAPAQALRELARTVAGYLAASAVLGDDILACR